MEVFSSSLQQFNSPVNFFPAEEMELLFASQFQSFNENYALQETVFDPYGPENTMSFPENYYDSTTLPYFLNQYEHLDHYSALDLYDYQQIRYDKRQKMYQDYHDPDVKIVQNPSLFQDFMVPEVMVPLYDFPSPPVYSVGNTCTACVKKPQTERTLSAQSIAARQRRRKITEKTQELGKLVPGGQKMNTAEMFQAAFKYIKYLQAQVKVLEYMGSSEDNGEENQIQGLQALVTSPLVQEKLYSIEKCLVPKRIIKSMENDNQIQSNPLVNFEGKLNN